MELVKITESKTLEYLVDQPFASLYTHSRFNLKIMKEVFGWLEKQETEPPQYNSETQYITDYWEQDGDMAVQKWEIKYK